MSELKRAFANTVSVLYTIPRPRLNFIGPSKKTKTSDGETPLLMPKETFTPSFNRRGRPEDHSSSGPGSGPRIYPQA